MTPARLAVVEAEALRDARRCDGCLEPARYACRDCGAEACGAHLVDVDASCGAHRWFRDCGMACAVVDLVREVRRLSAENEALREGGAAAAWVPPLLPGSILSRASVELPRVADDAARLAATRSLATRAFPWFTIRAIRTREAMVRDLGAMIDGGLAGGAEVAAEAALTAVALADDAPGATDVAPALAALALVEDFPAWLRGVAWELLSGRGRAR